MGWEHGAHWRCVCGGRASLWVSRAPRGCVTPVSRLQMVCSQAGVRGLAPRPPRAPPVAAPSSQLSRAFSGLKLPQGARHWGLPGLPQLENSVVAPSLPSVAACGGTLTGQSRPLAESRGPTAPLPRQGVAGCPLPPLGWLEVCTEPAIPSPTYRETRTPPPTHTLDGSARTSISWPREAKSLQNVGPFLPEKEWEAPGRASFCRVAWVVLVALTCPGVLRRGLKKSS